MPYPYLPHRRRLPHSISLGGFRTPAAEFAVPSLMRPASETLHTSGHWRACSTAHLHLAISSCEDFFAEALGFLNVENGFSLAIFFESSANGIERIVATGWLAAFIEQGEICQGEFFLGLRPKEWGVLASPFLQRRMKGNAGLLQPARPFLALAEAHKRGA